MPSFSKNPGFTLAELLIALALLGIIAAFTIPKVLQASGEQETNAKLKETVASLEQAWYNAKYTNQVIYGQDLYYTIAPALNTVAASTGHVGGAGAPLASVQATHPCATISGPWGSGWIQFANGVVVSNLAWALPSTLMDNLPWNDPTHDATNNILLCIDVNGAASPNLPGQDIFIGQFNQYGGFTGVPASENASLKAFRWGNSGNGPDSDIVDGLGAPYNSFGLNGQGNLNPSQVVGSRLSQ